MKSIGNVVTFQDEDPQNIRLILQGRLDIEIVAQVWSPCMELQSKYHPLSIVVFADKLTYCDGSGVAFLLALRSAQNQDKHQFSIQNLAPRFSQLMNLVIQKSSSINLENHEEMGMSFQKKLTMSFGKAFAQFLEGMKKNIIFVGSFCLNFLFTVGRLKKIRWKDFWKVLDETGPNALPIICLVGFLMGLISAFQAAIPLGEFGTQIYIANLVGISLVRELAPLLTAVILAGRTASAFAAEIGTMKINQEIDALTTMGLDSVKFLTIPKIIATTLVSPVLNIFMIIFGLIGCGIVMHMLGFNLSIYLEQLKSAVELKDYIGGLIKVIVFAALVSGVGCLEGLKTKSGASAVGNSTTRAVVNSIIMIIIADGIFAVLYYVLGV